MTMAASAAAPGVAEGDRRRQRGIARAGKTNLDRRRAGQQGRGRRLLAERGVPGRGTLGAGTRQQAIPLRAQAIVGRGTEENAGEAGSHQQLHVYAGRAVLRISAPECPTVAEAGRAPAAGPLAGSTTGSMQASTVTRVAG